jgi:hypothetical protein
MNFTNHNHLLSFSLPPQSKICLEQKIIFFHPRYSFGHPFCYSLHSTTLLTAPLSPVMPLFSYKVLYDDQARSKHDVTQNVNYHILIRIILVPTQTSWCNYTGIAWLSPH